MSEPKPACCSGPKEDEIFYLFGYTWVFNINLANEIIQDGRAPVEVEEASVRYCVETSDLVPEHVGHVDPSRPGIIAHVFYTTADGELIHGHALIDGNHRAARCLELERPFFAFILTEEESEKVLVRNPQRGTIDGSIIPAEQAAAKAAASGDTRSTEPEAVGPAPSAAAVQIPETASSLHH